MGYRKKPSRYPILKRSFPAKPGRRFLSFLIDGIILIAATAAIFLPTFNLVMASPLYATQEKLIVNEVNYYKDYSKESHIIDYNEKNEAISQDKTIYMYISRAICLSYEVFGNEGEPEFKLNDKVKTYGTLSKDNANCCYFYTNYLAQPGREHYIDMKGKSNVEFYYDQYYKAFAKPSSYFDMGSEKQTKYGLPVLKNTVAYQIMQESFSTYGTLSAETYQALAEGLAILLDNAESYLLNAEPYYTEHYQPYCKATVKCGLIMNCYLLICLALAGLVTYLLPKLIFKDGQTFGRRFIGLGVVQDTKERKPWWIIAIRTLFEVIGCLGGPVLLMYMLPPFNIDFSTLTMPMVYGTNFCFAFIIGGIMILYLLAKVPILFTHNKQSTLDILTHSIVVDSHFQEDDIDEDIEAKPL